MSKRSRPQCCGKSCGESGSTTGGSSRFTSLLRFPSAKGRKTVPLHGKKTLVFAKNGETFEAVSH
jgi:hypothetical protein